MGKVKTIFWHLLVIGVFIFLIILIPKEALWFKGSLLMIVSSIALADLLMLFFDKHNKASLVSAKLLTYLGFLLLAIFAVWVIAMIIWSMNLLFDFLGTDFRLDTIYSGHHLVVFSLPALISGLFLLAMGKMWEGDYRDEKNKRGRRKRAFR